MCLATILALTFIQALLMPKYIENPEGTLVGDYYDEAGGNDVLFLGDCEVYESFIPAVLFEEYGITSYVRGSAQQLVWQSYYLLEEMLEYERPRAVVFNVYALKYGEPQNDANNRMTLDGMSWSASKIDAVRASMVTKEQEENTDGHMQAEHFLEYVFPLLRFHSRITKLGTEDFEYVFKTNYVSHSGYLMQTAVKPMNEEQTPDDLFESDFPTTAIEYLDKMRELCASEGIELILVKAPTNHEDYWWYDAYETQVEAYVEQYGLEYINFIPLCDEIGIDWQTDTYDYGRHLNVFGAEKLTKYFGKILSEDFGMPDRRAESDVAAAWEKRIERYYTCKNSNK